MKSLYETLLKVKAEQKPDEFKKTLLGLVAAVTRTNNVTANGTGCNPACQEGYICDNGTCIRDVDLSKYVK